MASDFNRQPRPADDFWGPDDGYRQSEDDLMFGGPPESDQMFGDPPESDRMFGGPSGGGQMFSDGPADDDYDDELDYDDDYFDDEFIDATSRITRTALEWAVVLVGAVLVALLLRASLFQAFYIPSESMETTLVIDDRVLVNKLSYRLHDVHRGDIVVFARPDNQEGEIRELIKRVIALPGETIEGRDNQIYINGQPLLEPYLDEGVRTTDFGPEVVPEGEIFVMGDNRGESFDSRLFGTISQDRVVGRAFVLFWPLGRAGAL
jgi:signal peptidase I